MNVEIDKKLAEFIATEILKQSNRKIDPQAALISSGLIDSFSLIDLALFVEDEFGVHIDDSELNATTFDTIDQLSDLIQNRS